MSLRLWGTSSGWGRSAGAVIPALGSGRYSPGPNIVLPSWFKDSDPNCTLNVCGGQPGALATVSLVSRFCIALGERPLLEHYCLSDPFKALRRQAMAFSPPTDRPDGLWMVPG